MFREFYLFKKAMDPDDSKTDQAGSSYFSKRGFATEDGINVSEEELERLSKQPCLNQKWNEKLEVEAQKNWDKFYNRNNDKFFKDRNWAKDELEEVCSHIDFSVRLFILIFAILVYIFSRNLLVISKLDVASEICCFHSLVGTHIGSYSPSISLKML